MRLYPLFSAALAAVFLAACSSNGPAATTTGTGGATGGGGSGGGAPAPVIDPSLFDCTAKKAPVRVNAVPISCATDRSCLTHLVSGHRGAGGELGVIAPEDSLAAVRAAIVLGIDFVETDPRPTKDGHLVNVHDTDVTRIANGTGDVDQLTLAELKALTLITDKFPGDFSCERIATLEEILSAAKGRVHVLIDANKTNRVDLLVKAIVDTGTIDWAIFDTSSVEKIDEALALEPTLHTMLRVTNAADLENHLNHFAAHPPVIIEVQKGADTKAVIDVIHAAKNRAFTDVFVSDVAAALSDDPTIYDTYLMDGFDMLQSDRPERVLQTFGRWPPPPQP